MDMSTVLIVMASQVYTYVKTHQSVLFFFFWLCPVACGTFVPQPGIEPIPPAVGAQNLNQWTAREVPKVYI